MNESRQLTLGLVQLHMHTDREENLANAIEQVRQAARQGATLICLPELFLTRYFCQHENPSVFELAEPIPGPTTKRFGTLAQETQATLIVPLFERRTAGVYHNSAAVINAQGALAGTYRKMHIPDDPGYYEKYYFTPGDLGFPVFDLSRVQASVLICWDQWYPEAARLTALGGAEVLFFPTAIGWHPSEKKEHGAAQHASWQTIQRSHAIANGMFVAAVNRVGHEIDQQGDPGIEFWGSSFVCDPQGVLLAEASSDQQETLIVEIDLSHIENVRRHWPFLRDRRIDAYTGLDRRVLDE